LKLKFWESLNHKTWNL